MGMLSRKEKKERSLLTTQTINQGFRYFEQSEGYHKMPFPEILYVYQCINVKIEER